METNVIDITEWDNLVTIDTGYTNSLSNDDTRTMTEEQYNANLAKTGEISDSWYGQVFDTGLYFSKSVLEALQSPADGVKNVYNSTVSTVNGIMDKITLTGKVIVPIALIASAYLGLKFLAETKKNYRELKGKR